MLNRPLALSLRPIKFSQMVGQESVVNIIRQQYKSKREPSAWLFVGPTGTGKTSLARILALSLQCTHAELGEPCEECQNSWSSFWIKEINASEISGVEGVGEIASVACYVPPPPSRRLVIILDEAQRLSSAAQNLLLKYFEDAPKSTVWIICTTEQNKILETLRRRCQVMELKGLKADGIAKLVKRAYKVLDQKDVPKEERLVDALYEAGVQSPALVLNAVERYVAGQPAKDAVKYLAAGQDSLAVCMAVEKGDWNTIRKELEEASADDLRGVRAGVSGYLKKMLLKAIPGPKAKELAQAIDRIARVDSHTDISQGPATIGVLYELSQLFGGVTDDQDKFE